MEMLSGNNRNKNKIKLLVIKDYSNRGKTTLIWMVFIELVRLGANVVSYLDTWTRKTHPYPTTLPPRSKRDDIIAELNWNGKSIHIVSFGDVIVDVDNALQDVLKKNPDYIICAASIKYRGASPWNLFETKYTNLIFDRVCFWSEYTDNPRNEVRVKQPTVEAIVKYIA